MSYRRGNQLPNNLPQLQNVIKRDPESYKEEVSFLKFLYHSYGRLEIYPKIPLPYRHAPDINSLGL
jgi:protein SDA1